MGKKRERVTDGSNNIERRRRGEREGGEMEHFTKIITLAKVLNMIYFLEFLL